MPKITELVPGSSRSAGGSRTVFIITNKVFIGGDPFSFGVTNGKEIIIWQGGDIDVYYANKGIKLACCYQYKQEDL